MLDDYAEKAVKEAFRTTTRRLYSCAASNPNRNRTKPQQGSRDMYPLNQAQPFPRNQWYIATWRNEVDRSLFERRILDEPVVFYRTEAGEPVALAGLCPHRLYPLRKGRLIGDMI